MWLFLRGLALWHWWWCEGKTKAVRVTAYRCSPPSFHSGVTAFIVCFASVFPSLQSPLCSRDGLPSRKKKPSENLTAFWRLVDPPGLEPRTRRLWVTCSNQLSYGSALLFHTIPHLNRFFKSVQTKKALFWRKRPDISQLSRQWFWYISQISQTSVAGELMPHLDFYIFIIDKSHLTCYFLQENMFFIIAPAWF